jgi:hypothetical protein
MHVDGNAAAGLLGEVFATEMTAAGCVCGHCGGCFALAQSMAYTRAPGLVLRCPACGGVLLRIVRLRDRLSLDMSGLARVDC